MKQVFMLWGLLFVSILNNVEAWACAAFSLNDSGSAIVCMGFDWGLGSGAAIINPRNVTKKALGVSDPLEWTSLYGSVSFNHVGAEFPAGGMNEKGLFAQGLWLDETLALWTGAGKEIYDTQWLQYILDTKETVAEVKESLKTTRIVPYINKFHYLVCDATKACIAIEMHGGLVHVHDVLEVGGKKVGVLTNSSWEESNADLQKYAGFGGTEKIDALNSDGSGGPADMGPKARFRRTAKNIQEEKHATEPDKMGYGFEVLDAVRNGSYTKWQICFDQNNKKITFKTKSTPSGANIDFSKIDFDECIDKKARRLDLERSFSGNVEGQFDSTLFYFLNLSNTFRAVKNTGMSTPFFRALMYANYPTQDVKCGPRPQTSVSTMGASCEDCYTAPVPTVKEPGFVEDEE